LAASPVATPPSSERHHELAGHTISKEADLITLINVFTVDPSNQSRLVELLSQVTDTFVRRARGFISSSLHRSRDGTKVTMYAQWRSLGDYEAMRSDPGPVPYLEEALTIATFEPGIYDVVESFAPPAA
jgi:Antibiotic biosynthesis monooxygenase